MVGVFYSFILVLVMMWFFLVFFSLFDVFCVNKMSIVLVIIRMLYFDVFYIYGFLIGYNIII